MVSMGKVFSGARLLTVTDDGFGKLSDIGSYPLQKRGGKGVIAQRVNSKTGKVIAAMLIHPKRHLFIITAKGIVIRIDIDNEIPLQGRATQGVHLNRLDEDDKVASIASSSVVEEEIEEEKTPAK
jgi:DNA gyrase subunit A